MNFEDYLALSQATPTPRKLQHPEHDLQVACVGWFRLQYPQYAGLLFAVPNGAMLHGTPKQRAFAGKILRDEGMLAGVADLLLLLPNGTFHGLCIELKTAKGSQSEAQKEWGRLVSSYGYKYVVVKAELCRFMEVIKDYLKS